MQQTAVLLIHCQDQKGLVAAVSGFLFRHGANILHSDQHNDSDLGLFFQRVEWTLAGFGLDREAFAREFDAVARPFNMEWRVEYSEDRPRLALFVSKQLHCLADLLYRWRSGELACDIPLIVSNHPDGGDLARFYGVPFEVVPAADAAAAARRHLELLTASEISLIVLARYMRILPPPFVAAYPQRIINVHHAFLPAFPGAKPYHAAHARGVKLIGATAHFVTDALDEGPIIEQDVVRISHRDQIENLVEKGRDLERVVLARAVKWRLEHRVLAYANKTVVFD
jgi:formyltetrahydrofolate deformylase